MPVLFRCVWVSVVVTVALASCSDASAPTTATYDGFLDLLTLRQCERLAQCDAGGGSGVWNATVSVATCVASTRASRRAQPFDAYIENGSILYDREAADACIALYDAALCAAPWEGGICERVLVGAVADGGPCAYRQQCASTACNADGSGACGTCVETLAEGDPCLVDEGPRCAWGTRCRAGICERTPEDVRTQVGLDEPCDGLYRVCDPELYCGPAMVCARRLPRGALCDSDSRASYDECARGTQCAQPEDGSEARCLSIEVARAEDARCGIVGSEIVACDVERFLYCGPGTCLRRGELGDWCDESYECQSGLCADGSCVVPNLADGEPCWSDAECASGHCTDASVCGPVNLCE